MKNSFVCAVLVAASLFAVACSSAPPEPEPGLGSTEQALIPVDADIDPEPDYDATPPPPPPPPATTCTNITNDGVCRRYCCSETSSFKRCGVLPCPVTTTITGVWTTSPLLIASP